MTKHALCVSRPLVCVKAMYTMWKLPKRLLIIMSKTIILILDFGSQYTELIARRVRELGVYCEIYPYTMAESDIAQFNPAGMILSGGPATVAQQDTPRVPEIVFKLGCPVLGICYGMQAMAVQLGGTVA